MNKQTFHDINKCVMRIRVCIAIDDGVEVEQAVLLERTKEKVLEPVVTRSGFFFDGILSSELVYVHRRPLGLESISRRYSKVAFGQQAATLTQFPRRRSTSSN